MTRDEIDATLAALARREGFDGVKQLALILANQEERLRALEPCPGSPYYCGPHYFVEGREVCVPVCKGCQIEAPAKHRWNKSGVCENEYCSARKVGS